MTPRNGSTEPGMDEFASSDAFIEALSRGDDPSGGADPLAAALLELKADIDRPLPPAPQLDAGQSLAGNVASLEAARDAKRKRQLSPWLAGVIGAAHAGWKGTLGGILDATVDAMRALGATRIRAVVGPSISQRAYEVGDDFMDRFLVEDPDSGRFFSGGPNGRPMFDLPGFGVSRLRDLGVEAEWSGHCTYSDPDRFFSYRRSTHLGEADYGRLISAIAL